MFGDGTDHPRKWASPLFGEGEVRASEPYYCAKGKHGIPSYNLNKRVIHKGGGGGGARNSIPEMEKARKGNKLTVMDVSHLPCWKMEGKGRISLYQKNVRMRGQNIGKQ